MPCSGPGARRDPSSVSVGRRPPGRWTLIRSAAVSMREDIMFSGFDSELIATRETSIFVRRGGAGPPLLLLHGFPETHLMWRDIAPLLGRDFTVVCADLRGYGRSSCPPSDRSHSPYAKRAMALDMVRVMEHFGYDRFKVAGHDRGGRVAYRMALDSPRSVLRLAVLDVVPTATAWDRADARFALAFWPWTLLAQPEPLPERLLAAAPDAVIEDALGQWGSASNLFSSAVRGAYVEALSDAERVHAICEEYRAVATIDREHDKGLMEHIVKRICRTSRRNTLQSARSCGWQKLN